MRIEVERLARVGLNDHVTFRLVVETLAREFQETLEPIEATAGGPPFLQRQSRVWRGNSLGLGSWQEAFGPEQIVPLSEDRGRGVCILELSDSLIEEIETRFCLLVRRRRLGATRNGSTRGQKRPEAGILSANRRPSEEQRSESQMEANSQSSGAERECQESIASPGPEACASGTSLDAHSPIVRRESRPAICRSAFTPPPAAVPLPANGGCSSPGSARRAADSSRCPCARRRSPTANRAG